MQYIIGNKTDKEVSVADLEPIINEESDDAYEYDDDEDDDYGFAHTCAL